LSIEGLTVKIIKCSVQEKVKSILFLAFMGLLYEEQQAVSSSKRCTSCQSIFFFCVVILLFLTLEMAMELEREAEMIICVSERNFEIRSECVLWEHTEPNGCD